MDLVHEAVLDMDEIEDGQNMWITAWRKVKKEIVHQRCQLAVYKNARNTIKFSSEIGVGLASRDRPTAVTLLDCL